MFTPPAFMRKALTVVVRIQKSHLDHTGSVRSMSLQQCVLLLLACREVQIDAPDGLGYQRVVKPYLLDLETTNGTTINNERLEGARYYEVLSGDVIRFGFSSRDYVIMNESVV